MANSTDEYWSIDGVSLHQYGWSVSTIGGGRFGVPPMRGEDQQYAYVPGREFRAKIPDSRTITLAMWMTGTNPATGNYMSYPGGICTDPRTQWNDNWNYLRRLFWKPKRQFDLTRRWMLTDPVTHVQRLVAATARGQIVGDIQPAMTGRFRSEFQVDIQLADPFFYGGWITKVIPRYIPGQYTVINNPGDYDVFFRNFSIELSGYLNNPITMMNITPQPDMVMKYNTPVLAGAKVTVDVPNFIATSTTSMTNYGYNRTAFVSHSGGRPWMGLVPGDNRFALVAASTSGAGTATIKFRPPYL